MHHVESAVTMPQTHWNDVAIVLLEQVRILRREKREDLIEKILRDLLPPLMAAVSPEVRGLIAEIELDYGSDVPRRLAVVG